MEDTDRERSTASAVDVIFDGMAWLGLVPDGDPVFQASRAARHVEAVEQLLAMKAGDFIELDREPRIQASISGVPVFECQYGTHNSKYAIRIEACLRNSDLGWTGEKNGN